MGTNTNLTFTLAVTVTLDYCECGCKTLDVTERNQDGARLRVNGSIYLRDTYHKGVSVQYYRSCCGAGGLIKEGSARDWDEAHKLARMMVIHRYTEVGYKQLEPPFTDMGAGI